MSSGVKRKLADAQTEAARFIALFPPETYERWDVAGSVRRRKPEVGDIEHVVQAVFAAVPSGLFGEPKRENLLWRYLDGLVLAGTVRKYEYTVTRADGSTTKQAKWGDRQRGVELEGTLHEIFWAGADNYGCQLVIRTGPAEFSERMVTQLHGTMLRQDKGYLRYADGKVYPCPDERTFFAACHAEWKEPWERK